MTHDECVAELRKLQTFLAAMLDGTHDDHCGGQCMGSFELHDCCYPCNAAGEIAQAWRAIDGRLDIGTVEPSVWVRR